MIDNQKVPAIEKAKSASKQWETVLTVLCVSLPRVEVSVLGPGWSAFFHSITVYVMIPPWCWFFCPWFRSMCPCQGASSSARGATESLSEHQCEMINVQQWNVIYCTDNSFTTMNVYKASSEFITSSSEESAGYEWHTVHLSYFHMLYSHNGN